MLCSFVSSKVVEVSISVHAFNIYHTLYVCLERYITEMVKMFLPLNNRNRDQGLWETEIEVNFEMSRVPILIIPQFCIELKFHPSL